MPITCLRGEIYYATLELGFGSEQGGNRPVLILQNNIGNKFSPTTIVAPLSSQINTKAILPTHCHLNPMDGLVEPSIVLLEQIRVIDKTRLFQRLCALSEAEQKRIDHALRISLGLARK